MAPLAGKQIIQPIFELLVGVGLKEIHVNVHYLAYAPMESHGSATNVRGENLHNPRRQAHEYGGKRDSSESSKSPNSKALTTAWVRSETPNLPIMCSTWFLAVPELIHRISEIRRLVCPSLMRFKTSSSRGVRGSTRRSSRGERVPPCLSPSLASLLSSRAASDGASGESPSRTRHTASTTSSGSASLSTYPAAPALSASRR